MATLLYRWCRIAFAHPFRVLGAWLIVLVAIGGFIAQDPPELDTEFRVDGTPAQAAIDRLQERLPEASGGQGTMVFRVPEGQRIDEPGPAAGVARAVDSIYSDENVVDVRGLVPDGAEAPAVDPAGPQPLMIDGAPVPGLIVAADGSTALLQFQFTDQLLSLPTGAVDETVERAIEAAEGSDVEVLPGATLQKIPELFGVAEGIGLAVAALVLIMTMGSAIAAGVPLITALMGIGAGVGSAMALSHVLSINSSAISLALMLGLAVGIDYALFIVNRQRRLILDQGLTAPEAAARALGTAGTAVLFAGTTVIIALVAMVVVDIPVITVTGLVAAGTVALAVIVALTALPALLGLIGERVCTDKAKHRARLRQVEPRSGNSFGRVWIDAVIRHPVVAVLLVVIVTGVLAIPVASMRLGIPGAESNNPGTPQRDSYEIVSQKFGEGLNGPLVVVVTRVDDSGPVDPASVQELVAQLAGIKGSAGSSIAGISADGGTAIVSVVPATGPTDEETVRLVERIRDEADSYRSELDLAIGVTGVTALGIDSSEKVGSVMPLYLGVVVGLSLIVLLGVFRSIIIPIKATAGFLLSVSAAFGVSTAFFQWGWLQSLVGFDGTSPILCTLPILVAGILYGLAMDYQVFVVTSIREAHVHGFVGDEAVRRGFLQASKVVGGAAIIMVAVFAGFGFNPDTIVKQLGLTLAIGVLVDAFLVRMTLVPAVISMFGERAWWMPAWLERVLPDLDVEGARLVEWLDAEETEKGPEPRAGRQSSVAV